MKYLDTSALVKHYRAEEVLNPEKKWNDEWRIKKNVEDIEKSGFQLEL